MECTNCYPLDQPALPFALRPFNTNHAEDYPKIISGSPAAHTEIHKQGFCLPPLAPDGIPVSQIDSLYSKDESQQHLETPAHMEILSKLFGSLRRKEAIGLLMRCQVLQLTLDSIAHKSWAADSERLQLRHAENMSVLTSKALQLAQGLQDRGLQARAEFWAARACIAATRKDADDVPGAMRHIKRAKLLNAFTGSTETFRENVNGLMPKEKQELDSLLNSVRHAEESGAEVCCEDFLQALRIPQRGFSTREKMYIKYGKSPTVGKSYKGSDYGISAEPEETNVLTLEKELQTVQDRA
ncbi:hypothetical protein SVAN01_03493 [Stagonosporopsis vannaccii]|nr:hypothetical protein SVAN01_03493 [Stagonosporopsis vannaccii]